MQRLMPSGLDSYLTDRFEPGCRALGGVFAVGEPLHIIRGVAPGGINPVNARAECALEPGSLPLFVQLRKVFSALCPFVKSIFSQKFFALVEVVLLLLNPEHTGLHVSVRPDKKPVDGFFVPLFLGVSGFLSLCLDLVLFGGVSDRPATSGAVSVRMVLSCASCGVAAVSVALLLCSNHAFEMAVDNGVGDAVFGGNLWHSNTGQISRFDLFWINNFRHTEGLKKVHPIVNRDEVAA